MAGQGTAPKSPDERRNKTPPQRGEWIDLPSLEAPVLPALPKRAKGTGAWSARTRAAWAAWRSDPVTTQYAIADIQGAIDLAFLYEDWVRGKDFAAEIRQRQDRLGLNPKGRRDLRWRAPQERPAEKSKSAPRKPSRRGHLVAVN